jgi:protein-S-isoprenylcysteine O-methyltransferase Ste14
MYVGGLIALAGEALVYHAMRIVAYALVVFAMWHWFVVTHEEPALTRVFGEAYGRYCATVPRWLPRLKR